MKEFVRKLLRKLREWIGHARASPRLIFGRFAAARIQQRALDAMGIHGYRNLVVYFIPGIQAVTGGVLQIFALQRLTRELFKGSDSVSVICWLPREGIGYTQFEGFKNDETVFEFARILAVCKPSQKLLLHVPEYATELFCERLGWDVLATLRKKHGLVVSIMNQHHARMAEPDVIAKIKRVCPDVNCSVGHSGWATLSERQRLGIPLHFIPTWYYPDNAPWAPYESKSNLMIVSPDAHQFRDRVLAHLRMCLPDLDIRVIWDMKYETYLDLERSARWSLTFGEGLDGYFYGPMLRGGIAFAVRNSTFDLPGLENRRTIYPNYDSLLSNIVEDIKSLDSKEAYETYNLSVREALVKEFDSGLTKDALQKYYAHDWTVP
jgi:hypothetical protein